MAEKIYADGLRTFAKHDKAPDFVLGTLIITPEDLYAWIKANPTHLTDYQGKKQLRLQITKGDSGRVNLSVDTWKPGAGSNEIPNSPAKEKFKESLGKAKASDQDLPF